MINRVKISIQGKNYNYFLKELTRRKINIYNIEKNNKIIEIIVDYDDYKKITDIKTTYKIKIIRRYGLNRYIYLLKTYSLIILMFIIGLVINILLSHLILKVEVIHPNKRVRNKIYNDLNRLGLRKFKLKLSYNQRNEIKEKILEQEKDTIEWLEIEEQGTKYIVKVEERKKNKEENKCPERNIIAKKNAIITRIEAVSGEVIKKKNDYVSQGETIISGLIHNKETIVTKRCSEGKIYGEVWYTVKVLIPKELKKEKYYDSYDYGMTIRIFDKDINLFNKLLRYKKYEYNIIKSDIIPIKISFAKFQKKKLYKTPMSDKNSKELAVSLATKRISKKLKSDEHIISKKVLKKNEFNSKIEIEVFFKVEENITEYQNIEQINIEEMNKKE